MLGETGAEREVRGRGSTQCRQRRSKKRKRREVDVVDVVVVVLVLSVECRACRRAHVEVVQAPATGWTTKVSTWAGLGRAEARDTAPIHGLRHPTCMAGYFGQLGPNRIDTKRQ